MATGRGIHIPIDDLILETELQIARESHYTSYRCPCTKCHGGRRYSIKAIQQHLHVNKRDPFLRKSMLGGDLEGGYPEQGIWVNAAGETIAPTNVFDDEDARTEYAEHLDPYHDIQRQFFDALDEGDRIHKEALHVVQESDFDSAAESSHEIEDLYEQATRPLYTGTNVSIVSAIIVLINMAVIHGVSNAYVDELLKYLSSVLLPSSNMLPGSHYEAKKLIRKLGLNYHVIHTCPAGCILYRGVYEDLKQCPKCNKGKFIAGSNVIPARVIRHFPLIPRLQRMYRSPAIAKMLRFHADQPNTDATVMKSVVDSLAWKHINTDVDPEFGNEVRNLCFGMALDGVNPFMHNTTSHSTWPMLMLIYNLPPHMVTKNFFIELTILVSGKKSPTNENIDIFIRPIIEELQELWRGVPAQDFSKPPSARQFTLRAILMWTISDYPGYGLISGLCTHGYKVCTVCGPGTDARSAASGNKVNAEKRAKGRKLVYGGSRRWTRRKHPYRENLQFNGEVEDRRAPTRMTVEERRQCGEDRETYLANGSRKGANDDPVHVHGVKQRSALNDLSYWTKLLIHHLLDPMHCEKNLCENMLKTICGEKDCIGSRQDMEAMNIRPYLWLGPSQNRRETFNMPIAPYILTSTEKITMMEIIKNLRTPTNYVRAIHKCLEDGKLRYLKSHDFHVLMQQVLPLALRNALIEDVRQAVMKVSRVFQRLCAREIKIADRDADITDTADVLCMLEKVFPPTFMDIMSHLMIHLVEELYICGPVHSRWMYPIERYMKTLKEYVRTYACPEASMAEGYAMFETLGYCTEYMQRFHGTGRHVWDDKEEQRINDEVLQGSGRRREMSPECLEWAHEFILSNSVDFDQWRQEYSMVCEETLARRQRFQREDVRHFGRNARVQYPEECQLLPRFSEWVRVEVQKAIHGPVKPSADVIQASELPELLATSYRAMYAHGMHFRVRSAEEDKVTCNSAIAASVLRYRRGILLRNFMEWEKSEYVGWIEEILELDYRNHCCIVLLCSWVQAELGATNSNVFRDKYGFIVANFSRPLPLGPNSFAFPTQCQQVFFSDDLERQRTNGGNWKVVCGTSVRSRRGDAEVERPEIDILKTGRDSDFQGLIIGR